MNQQAWYNLTENSGIIKLSYSTTTSLRLTMTVNSGTHVGVDWGDGSGIVPVLANGTQQLKTFSTPQSGTVVVYSRGRVVSITSPASTPAWNFDVSVFSQQTTLERIDFTGAQYGNINNISPTILNVRMAGTGNITGSGAYIPLGTTSFQILSSNASFESTSEQISNLTSLVQYRLEGNCKHTGDINILPAGLVILSLKNTGTPLHEISYTSGRTWASNMRVVELLPKSGFGLTTEEGDNLLIDLSQTSWTNEKVINIAGNNAQRSVASDEAKAILDSMGVTVTVNEPSTFYVRPTGTTYGAGDGTSYADAWSGFTTIDTELIEGNRLAVCGTHNQLLSLGSVKCHIDFDDANEPGVIDCNNILSVGMLVIDSDYIYVNRPNITKATVSCIDFDGCYGVTDNGTFTLSANQGVQHHSTNRPFAMKHINPTTINCADDGISGHGEGTIEITDGTYGDNAQSGINVIDKCVVTLSGNPTFYNNIYDIWVANATEEESCSVTATGCNFANIVKASNLAKIILHDCYAPNVTLESTSFAELNTSVIDALIVGANTAVINNCRLNDINSISAGGFVEITDSYVKPVGVFDNNGTLRLLRTLFDSSDCTDHTIDNNSGAVFKAQHCIFRNPIAGKYALSIRTGSTVEALEGITLSGTSNIGRGIYSQISITAKNTIITGLDIGITVAVSGQDVTLENGCLFDLNTTANGSGSLIQNDMQNTDPLFTDAINEDYSLGAGSDCIGNGETLSETEGFNIVDWGDASTVPTVSTQTLSVFNIGAI